MKSTSSLASLLAPSSLGTTGRHTLAGGGGLGRIYFVHAWALTRGWLCAGEEDAEDSWAARAGLLPGLDMRGVLWGLLSRAPQEALLHACLSQVCMLCSVRISAC
jgi:hypothetical protein